MVISTGSKGTPTQGGYVAKKNEHFGETKADKIRREYSAARQTGGTGKSSTSDSGTTFYGKGDNVVGGTSTTIEESERIAREQKLTQTQTQQLTEHTLAKTGAAKLTVGQQLTAGEVIALSRRQGYSPEQTRALAQSQVRRNISINAEGSKYTAGDVVRAARSQDLSDQEIKYLAEEAKKENIKITKAEKESQQGILTQQKQPGFIEKTQKFLKSDKAILAPATLYTFNKAVAGVKAVAKFTKEKYQAVKSTGTFEYVFSKTKQPTINYNITPKFLTNPYAEKVASQPKGKLSDITSFILPKKAITFVTTKIINQGDRAATYAEKGLPQLPESLKREQPKFLINPYGQKLESQNPKQRAENIRISAQFTAGVVEGLGTEFREKPLGLVAFAAIGAATSGYVIPLISIGAKSSLIMGAVSSGSSKVPAIISRALFSAKAYNVLATTTKIGTVALVGGSIVYQAHQFETPRESGQFIGKTAIQFAAFGTGAKFGKDLPGAVRLAVEDEIATAKLIGLERPDLYQVAKAGGQVVRLTYDKTLTKERIGALRFDAKKIYKESRLTDKQGRNVERLMRDKLTYGSTSEELYRPSNIKALKAGTIYRIETPEGIKFIGKVKSPGDLDIALSKFSSMDKFSRQLKKASGGKLSADPHTEYDTVSVGFSQPPETVFLKSGGKLRVITLGEQSVRKLQGTFNVGGGATIGKPDVPSLYRFGKDLPGLITDAKIILQEGVTRFTRTPMTLIGKARLSSAITRLESIKITPDAPKSIYGDKPRIVAESYYKELDIPTQSNNLKISSIPAIKPKLQLVPSQNKEQKLSFERQTPRPSYTSSPPSQSSFIKSFSKSPSPSRPSSQSKSPSRSQSPSPSLSRSPSLSSSPSPSISRSASLSKSPSLSPSPSPSRYLSPSPSPSPSKPPFEPPRNLVIDFKLKGEGRRYKAYKQPKSKQKFGFEPTVYAVTLGLKSKKKPQKVFTGFEVREVRPTKGMKGLLRGVV